MTDLRPDLSPDLWYRPVDGGLLLRTTGTSIQLAGADLHPLLDRLAPYLDGTTELGTLVAGLPPTAARVVRQLVATLLEHGMARDAAAELPHGLARWELRRYAQEIEFVAAQVDSATNHFERFRRSHVLVLGAGGLLAALVQALLRLGLRSPNVAVTAEARTDPDWQYASLAACRAGDPTVGLALRREPELAADPAGLAASLTGFDAILHCSDRPMLGRAVALTRAARIAGVPIQHALPVAGAGWIGPAGDGCFECAAWPRWGAAATADAGTPRCEFADVPDAPPEPYLSGSLAGLVSGLLAVSYLQLAVGGAGSGGSRMTRVELRDAATEEHPIPADPRCRACAA